MRIWMSYGVMHAISMGVHRARHGVSWSTIAAATGYDADYIRKEVKALQLGEKDTLSPKLAEALEEAIPAIHNEVPVHSYSIRVFHSLFDLRDREDAARALLRERGEGHLSVDDVLSLWNAVLDILAEPYLAWTVRLATSFENQDAGDFDQEARTIVYVSAALLHSLAILWEDAAKILLQIDADCVEDKVLDFDRLMLHDLGIVSVLDVAEAAQRLYQSVDFDLLRLAKHKRNSIAVIKASIDEIKLDDQTGARETEKPLLEERLGVVSYELDLIEQDRGIVSINLASISSHADDWAVLANGYVPQIGVGEVGALDRISLLRGMCQPAIKHAIPLMKLHKRNLLIARNLAYMAIQHDVRDVIMAAADHLAKELKIEQDQVWAYPIAKREPLATEKDIGHKFRNGQPILLTNSKAA
ncbi:hypothetical protein [Rhizobium sp. Root483D2]|uniref:hypothetical protein n=1 Tax=Rhizobium sp. Root483D2 TaxID=1736545 RepID=UPI00071512FE|nr:hypothetical protein [Rhizobium sp. Root483D2]KQY25954.1 hypothetical protein ASD32_26095 [Rhizobium sp. Root483D2]